MKSKRIIFILLLVIYFPLCGNTQNYSSDAYEFPVKPGTPEWKELKSYPEMIEAMKIPENILATISTKGLVETCLKYPDLMNITAFRTYQEGFNNIINRFNGYQELLNRQDSGEELLNIYKQLSPENNDSFIQDQAFPDVFEFLNIEMLLAQKEIINSLTKDKKIELCNVAIDLYDRKTENSEKFGKLTKISSCLIIVRTLLELQDSDFSHIVNQDSRLILFAEEGNLLDVDLMQNIVITAKQIIYNNY